MFTLLVWLPYLDVLCILVYFSCEHFAMSVDDLMGDKFNKQRVHDTCLHRRTVKDYCRAICIFELIMFKRGLLLVPGIVFFFYWRY